MLRLKDTKVTLKCLAFSPDGNLLVAAGYEGKVQLWDPMTGTLRQRLAGLHNCVNHLFFTPDGSTLIGAEHQIQIWNLLAEPPSTMRWREFGFLRSGALSPDGRTLCLSDYRAGYRCEAYRFPEGELLWEWEVESYSLLPATLAFSPTGRTLLAGYLKGTVRVLDASNGADGGKLGQVSNNVKAMAISPDGRSLAIAAGGHLHLIRLNPLAELAHHRLGRTHFLDVAFHPTGEFLASVNGDGKVDYWSTATGEHREAFDWEVGKLCGVTFDPTGHRAACCSAGGEVVVWDVDL